VRPYQPGDDVRAIDWNVSARMNDAFVKVFVEEREMTVMLVVDLSASERFGTRRAPKTRVASEVAALLAFSAIRNNDRVGLIVATDKVERIVPPKKGEKHVMRVVREILGFEPTARPATSVGRSPSADREGSHSQLGAAGRVSQLGPVGVAQLGAAGRVSQLGPVGVAQLGAAGRVSQLGPAGVAQLGAGGRPHSSGLRRTSRRHSKSLAHVSRRRSIAFVVSDFYDTGYERALALASAKHDVIPVVLIDPRDRALPDVGLATFEDLESGESIVVDTGDPSRPGLVRGGHEEDRRVAAGHIPQARARLGPDRNERLVRPAAPRPFCSAGPEDPAMNRRMCWAAALSWLCAAWWRRPTLGPNASRRHLPGPSGRSSPTRFPPRGTSGYAATLHIVVSHGRGETVLPRGLELQSESDAARALKAAGFRASPIRVL
jgi:hypothetical protein